MTCNTCGKRSYSEYCVAHKPRKPIITNAVPKRTALPSTRSRIKQRGKYFTKWSLAKEDWFTQYGQYHPCHYCGIGLKPETITLDHLIPRSRAPALRYVLTNLVPCCFMCNNRKGSIDHDSYPHICRT